MSAPESISSAGETAAPKQANAEETVKTEGSANKRTAQPHAPIGESKLSVSGLLLLGQILVALMSGAILGAFGTAQILESEYQSIVSSLHTQYKSTVVQTQKDYLSCQSHLSTEKQSNEEEVALLRIRADQNERAFQLRAEQYLNETIMAYEIANEGLERASSRLRTEVKNHQSTQKELSRADDRLQAAETEAGKHESTRLELSQVIERLRAEVEDHESMQRELYQANQKLQGELSQANERLQGIIGTLEEFKSTQQELSQANRRIQAMRNTVTESSRALEESQAERDRTSQDLEHLQRELDAVEQELDRRDVERAECDVHHREMLACRESLKEALVEPANSGSSASCDEGGETTARLLAQVMEEKEELSQDVQSLEEEGGVKDAMIKEAEFRARKAEREAGKWEKKVNSMIEKIKYRSQKEVLEQYGPGPYHAELTLAFPSAPLNESVLVELAPLEMMPHTILIFLNMVQKKLYNGGTFILARDHILVAGPVDAHNPENNAELEERMLYEGFFPDGALLFKEYSSDYPHVPYTMGFNSGGGPVFYINLLDNTNFHGGGAGLEADPCFATLVEGMDVIQRIVGKLPDVESDTLEQAIYIVDSHLVNRTA